MNARKNSVVEDIEGISLGKGRIKAFDKDIDGFNATVHIGVGIAF